MTKTSWLQSRRQCVYNVDMASTTHHTTQETTAMTTKTTTQTVAELHAEQMLVPDWMRQLGKPTDVVRVTRRHTPFGVYVVHAQRV